MTNEELQNIIDQFDENDLKQTGTFGIWQYGGGGDESFIKANKEGLQLFALNLLKSAKESDGIIADKEKNIITFDIDEYWIDEGSDVFIHYIEPIADKQKTQRKSEYKPKFIDKLLPVGCGLILLILVIAIFVGLGTMFDWFF